MWLAVQFTCCRQRCFVWTVLHTPGWHTGTRDFVCWCSHASFNFGGVQFHNPAMLQQCFLQVPAGCLLLAHAHTAAVVSMCLVASDRVADNMHMSQTESLHSQMLLVRAATSVRASALALWLLNCVHALLC